MRIREKIAKAKAPKPKRQAIEVPNAAVAERIKRDRGIVSAIRDTRAQVGALADEVEGVQNAGRDTARRVRQVEGAVRKAEGKAKAANAATARRLEQHAADVEANRPADLESSAAILAQWQAERDVEIAAARADHDREYDRVMEVYHAAYQEANGRAAARYAGADNCSDAWQKMLQGALAPYYVQLDALTDKLFDRLESAEAAFKAKRTAALPLPTTDAVMAEWETDRKAITARWRERCSYYRTQAAEDAGYQRYSDAWDAAEDRVQALWDAADAHETRVTQFLERYGLTDSDKEAKAMQGMSEAILALRIQHIEADAEPPAPFGGYCEFYVDHDGEVKIGGLTIDAFVKAYAAALRDLGGTDEGVRFKATTTTMEV